MGKGAKKRRGRREETVAVVANREREKETNRGQRRDIVRESTECFQGRRSRREGEALSPPVNKRRRQSRIMIMRQWRGRLSQRRELSSAVSGTTEKSPALDERLHRLRYLLCARALVIMRLASRGSQRIRERADSPGLRRSVCSFRQTFFHSGAPHPLLAPSRVG